MAHCIAGDCAARESPTTRVKINYDAKTDTLSLIRKENVAIAGSAEGKPAVLLDFDGQGYLVSMEILDGSRRGTEGKR
jgi:Protein of unknown function (DUF2283)